jgi:Family of unknown function (DUF6492)
MMTISEENQNSSGLKSEAPELESPSVRLPAASAKWAVITPSYKGDYERCRILCQSMDAFMLGNWHHYIIVETVDLVLFQGLSSNRRTIVEMEAMMPRSFYHLTRIPFVNSRSLWFSFKTGFMIGWHVQQLVKLQMAFEVDSDGLLYCDSDVFFIRPFDVTSLTPYSQFSYYTTYHRLPREVTPNPKYLDAAAKQLGLNNDPFPCASYVENIVIWHAPTVRAMCKHIQKVAGKDWRVALGRNLIISEYSLYGLFVDRILDDKSHLRATAESLCKTAWNLSDLGSGGLDEFCDTLTPPQVAVGFQSFLGVKESDLALQLQRAVKLHSLM